MNDAEYMQLAIDLAEKGLYTASPNPRVGCVIVRDGQIIGRGYHVKAGQAHAEVNAIADAGNVEAATVYVTLEPCSHTGRTPPCSDALIAAKVAKVIVAMTDPNPLVSGNGIAKLQQAGIDVELGLLELKARQLNPGYIKRMESGLPWVRVKLAMSLDGRTAMASGESQWITGKEARSDVQRLRARSCVVMSGIDTVIADNASLTVRADELGLDAGLAEQLAEQQPVRVVLDSSLRLPLTAKLLSVSGRLIIMTAVDDPSAEQALMAKGAEVVHCGSKNGQVDLAKVLQFLGEMGVNEILVEAGATLAGALTEAGLVDQYTVYMAPTLLGSNARPLLQLPLMAMAEQQRLQIDSIRPIGDDWRIDSRPAKK
ncbi:MAG: bifunctional diaminohydroxyphosphoribosylaminopyrimidine deaminase/5-amino-6-(5-phosphoribosylamino)uracil reductase RibD [Oceanicoccus sp.]